MTFYFLILFALYFALLLVLRIGWSKAFVKNEIAADKTYFISVIIPVRNEEKNIETLLRSLENQSYLKSNFEIILINDHSTDNSVKKVEENKDRLQNWTILSLGKNENGKKAALTFGIQHANGEIIATTDADCRLPAEWISMINSAFQNKQCNMAAGMVSVVDENSFFSRWQTMELASVIGTGAAAFGLHSPMMCNGANLAFRREVFQQVKGYEGNEHIASGDDEFLMRKIQYKYPGSIQMMNSIVVTQPQKSLGDFFQQRIRWASKWKGNPSILSKLLAVFILVTQLSWIIFLVTFYRYDFKNIFALLMLKIIADLIFLLPVFRLMKIKFRLTPFLGLQFLYPFYVIFVGLLAPWISYQWKDRKIL
jgi:biofilm PGA synthesis N-glycosyltransferase PgaC